MSRTVPNAPTPSAKNDSGDFERFKNFMQRLMAVPHSDIKAQLDAEKAAKQNPNASSESRS